ncbi:hypothetical protein K504DRAFT_444386 [Pleomassaria siparia CBS 279.74]|uniref:PCI domain-containing protein n=1 Tax=Pleomassaria siparia CBS 279.74 TaxID=1314801 RepID=A0A6G1JRC2_9PLEO|nr:hypothetical protein K504DRAFT_444386 [Pleomassaria siparia CBS 279.74]
MSAFQAGIESNFCTEVNTALRNRDANKLQSILLLEPPFPPVYQQLIDSLKKKFPGNDSTAEKRLEDVVKRLVTEAGEGEDDDGRPIASWSPMVTFLVGWMAFIRDINIENLLETYERLSDLQQKANSALQHPTKGILMLPTVVGYAKVFSRVAIGLDKHPELIQHLVAASVTDEGHRDTLPEKAANVVRQAFIICLNDRNTAPGGIKAGKPDGKKVGIYKMANICLRILFQADKLESCQTIFDNIYNSSPPLSIYPASERVTYLYYLGRWHFAETNFYEAQLALQEAYDHSPSSPSCKSQRRLILIYLIASNILLGRFPSTAIYTLPEAHDLRARFEPLTRAIRRGDLETFRRITDLDLSHEHAAWFIHYRIFYQLGNYCEVYVWRSLFRKVFLLSGQQGATERSAPTIDLHAVLVAFQYFERRAHMTPGMAHADAGPGRRHITFVLQDFTPPPSSGYIDPDFDGVDGLTPYIKTPDILEIESICGSLVMQGFLNGFISHKSKRFAITGARKAGSALLAGFPNIWEVISKRKSQDVHGWRKQALSDTGGGGGVIRLSGARPAGS